MLARRFASSEVPVHTAVYEVSLSAGALHVVTGGCLVEVQASALRERVKLLRFGRFDGFREALLQSDDLAACMLALEQQGFSADLKKARGPSRDGQRRADARFACEVRHVGGPLGPGNEDVVPDVVAAAAAGAASASDPAAEARDQREWDAAIRAVFGRRADGAPSRRGPRPR